MESIEIKGGNLLFSDGFNESRAKMLQESGGGDESWVIQFLQESVLNDPVSWTLSKAQLSIPVLYHFTFPENYTPEALPNTVLLGLWSYWLEGSVASGEVERLQDIISAVKK